MKTKFIILNSLYFILSTFLSAILWGAGHGSIIPVTAFLGIFSIPIVSHYSLNLGPLLFLALIQTASYALIGMLFIKINCDKKYFKILPILHYLGAITVLLVFEKKIPRFEHLLLFFIIAGITVVYWKVYFSILAKKE